MYKFLIVTFWERINICKNAGCQKRLQAQSAKRRKVQSFSEDCQKFGTYVSSYEMAAKPDTAKYSSDYQLLHTTSNPVPRYHSAWNVGIPTLSRNLSDVGGGEVEMAGAPHFPADLESPVDFMLMVGRCVLGRATDKNLVGDGRTDGRRASLQLFICDGGGRSPSTLLGRAC